MNNKIHITPSVIPSEQEKKVENLDLNNIFDDDLLKYDEPQKKSSSKKRKKTSKNNKKYDVEDVRQTLQPSRSGNETNDGGNFLEGNNNSIFDSNRIGQIEESKLTKRLLKDSKERKAKRNYNKRDDPEVRSEWEQVKPAQKTSDIPANQMGFTPNRSAYKPKYDDKKYKIQAIENEKKKQKESIEAGKEAANIKKELDNIMMNEWEQKIKGDWDWEKEALSDINKTKTKNIESKKEKIEFAKEFTPVPKKVESRDLSGLFSPLVPEIEEKSIKRDSSKIKEKRKKRSEDRSWEKLSKPKKFEI